MLVLYVLSALLFLYDRPKSLSSRSIGNNDLFTNKSFIVEKKAVAKIECESPPTGSDAVDCEAKFDAAYVAATSATWTAANDINTEVGAYVTSCTLSKCGTGCAALISEQDLKGPAPANFISDFSSKCQPPRISGAVTCTPPGTDIATCSAKYQAVIDAIGNPTWVGGTVKKAINEYITDCGATKCESACTNLIDKKDLKAVNNDIKNSFASSCKPIKKSNVASCSAETIENSEICPTTYEAVKTALNGQWNDGSTIQAAVNKFLTDCQKTSCTDSCKTLVSAKEFNTQIPTYKTQFEGACNPAGPQPEDDSKKENGYHIWQKSKLLVAISIGLALLQFLLP
jgi:hypothetical protein